jgi:hypothetical protein
LDTLPLVFSSGWSSGVNAYATVLVMGLLGRFAGVDAVPPGLQSTEVLLAAALFFAMEFVADKIPYVDSIWDAVHTAIRPTIGGVIGLLIAGESDDLAGATAAALGGGTALLSHAIKAGVRLGVNVSPEPFSNIILSLAEDATVVTVVTLGLAEPWLAAAIAMFLLILGLATIYLGIRVGRTLWRRRPANSRRVPP